jgi:hypothetical protein
MFTGFMEQTEHLEKDPTLLEVRGETFCTGFWSVRKAVEGLKGLASPKPCAATLEAVQYVYPTNYLTGAKIGFGMDVSRVGRAVILALRRSELASAAIWAVLNKEFLDTLGFAMESSDEYYAFEADLDKLVKNPRTQKAWDGIVSPHARTSLFMPGQM